MESLRDQIMQARAYIEEAGGARDDFNNEHLFQLFCAVEEIIQILERLDLDALPRRPDRTQTSQDDSNRR